MPIYKKIHQIPAIDRPREKLRRKGAQALSDFELLEVLISSGCGKSDVGQIARQVQKLLRKGTQSLSYEALLALPGVNIAIAGRLLSALEISKRHLVKDVQPLTTVQDVLARLDDIRNKQQEYLICFSLDGGQRLIAQRTITIGTLDTVLAHPREVYADPLMDRAACIIVAHNHPSGDLDPSREDVALTQQLAAAGQLVGVPLRDHVIVTHNNHFSYRQHHLL